MPTIAEQLTQLTSDRDDLVTNLTTQGITGLTGDETYTELVPKVLDISTGGGGAVEPKDVNFYDYDGTITNSYTYSEFANLSSMPENPTHTGLTSQGWNWTLSDAKTYVQTYKKLNIGQMYITDDGDTRIYITIAQRKSPLLGLYINGTATIDWGDNTTDTVTGSSTSTKVDTSHTYSASGNYVIKIKPTSGTSIRFAGANSKTYILWGNGKGDRAYSDAIDKIEFGSGITTFGSYTFIYCDNLKYMTIPSQISTFPNYAFYYCQGLKYVTVPNTVTSLGSQCFQQCVDFECVSLPNTITSISANCFANCNLKSITIPSSVTSIGSNSLQQNEFKEINIPSSVTSIESTAFSGCTRLNSVTIPNSVTSIASSCFESLSGLTYVKVMGSLSSINNSAFSYATALMYANFSNCSAIPTLQNTNCFANTPSDFRIIVPDSLYDDWKVANNWSSYASKIIKASDFTE